MKIYKHKACWHCNGQGNGGGCQCGICMGTGILRDGYLEVKDDEFKSLLKESIREIFEIDLTGGIRLK